MNEIELFLKEFIESKDYKRLVAINSLSVDMLLLHVFPFSNLVDFINFLKNDIKPIKGRYLIRVNGNCSYKNRRGEYLLNSEYSLRSHEVIDYYQKWKREQSIQNIIE
jgi:hypothetical protein